MVHRALHIVCSAQALYAHTLAIVSQASIFDLRDELFACARFASATVLIIMCLFVIFQAQNVRHLPFPASQM